jgi:uncharacterized OB-fold protein
MNGSALTPDEGSPVGPEAQFRRFLAAGRIALQHCAACGRNQYYPSVVCRACGARPDSWVESHGLGTVYACTVVAAEPAFNVALVDLDEGVRVLTRLEPGELPIGTRVRGRIATDHAAPMLVFEAAP